MSTNQQKKPLDCSVRDKSGTGAARAVRREGKVPAILYSKKSKPVCLAISKNELTQEYMRGRFNSRIVELTLDGKTIRTLPQDIQFHPVSDQIEHVDFLKVEDGAKVRVSVPVVFRGTEKAVGVKRGGVLNIVRHEIEFTCLPEAIPASIEINVQKMDIGDSMHIEQIELPEGVEPTIKRNFTIATIAGRGKSLEEEDAEAAAAAATAEGETAEGAEGEAADAKKEEGKKDDAKKEEKK